MSSSDAVLYGVGALADSISGNSSQTTVARSAAGAFACGAPINDLFQDGGVLNTAHVLADFKAFLASEIRRISSERGVKESELCDVSERSLREWVRAGNTLRQNSTDQRRNSSEGNNT